MSVSINTTFHFNSGSIPFSSLREVFKRSESGTVKASELIRNTSIYSEDPVVPDADENTNIASTQSDWKTSQFRGSCKEYEAVQSGTDADNETSGYGFRCGRAAHGPGGIPWGGNMTKNIKKNVYITGEIGCNNPDPSTAALGFSPDVDAPNMYIEVSGTVRGAGGTGGSVPGGAGNPGGPGARFITNRPLKVAIVGSGFIRGGGGGGTGGNPGSDGADGSDGNSARCRKVNNNRGRNCCRSCGNCPSGYRREYCYNRQGRCGWCGQYREWECRRTQNETRDPGTKGFKGFAGAGSAGSDGRGWNNYGPGSSIAANQGNPGNPGNPGNNWQRCRDNWRTENRGNNGNPGNKGNPGNPGGNGGRWGERGGGVSGGNGGRGISGSGYSVIEGIGNIVGGY